MRFSLRWLFEYLETTLSYEEILDAITMNGLEVEQANDLGLGSGQIVFGEIVDIKPHPNADKLSLCQVLDAVDHPIQIVCGANNISVGQKVPLARVGATLPDGMKLKPTKIRGVESQGMMCSARELGMGDDHDGIWIQPEDSPVGEPFDATVEIKVTPNRPDALSLIGVARDVAARGAGKLVLPEVKFTEVSDRAENAARVLVEAREDCPRYAARVVRNVRIGRSPLWLRRRLESAGLRPVNNVVDVTNYVMLEMGHPLHAFDMEKITGRTIVVRTARAGEKLALLDESEVELTPGDLLICDTEKPLALAGVMGGADSGITEETKTILLEAAYFRPATIRRTSKRLGKSTDSSYRFERGTDARKLHVALHRAAQLIHDIAGAEVLKGHIDVIGKLPDRDPITLRIARARMLSGLSLTGRQISEILIRLGFDIQRATEQELVVAAPSFRPDIDGEADLIEEVVRIHGTDKIPSLLPPRSVLTPQAPTTSLETAVADYLVAAGVTQAVNFSFIGESSNALAGFDAEDPATVSVQNPLSRDQAQMRRSLVPSLLQNVVNNLNMSVETIRLFEIGRTYAWAEDDDANANPKRLDPPATERPWLAMVLCGAWKADWRTASRELDFYDLKGIAQGMLEHLGFSRLVVEPAKDVPTLHPGRAAAFLRSGERICWFGELHPAIARELDLKKRVYLLECPLDGPIASATDTAKYRELPRTPAAKRDIALLVPEQASALELERAIRSAAGDILSAVRLFDLYEGKNIKAGHRSIAFSLTFRDSDPEKTLTDTQVNDVMAKIVGALEKKTGATLRS